MTNDDRKLELAHRLHPARHAGRAPDRTAGPDGPEPRIDRGRRRRPRDRPGGDQQPLGLPGAPRHRPRDRRPVRQAVADPPARPPELRSRRRDSRRGGRRGSGPLPAIHGPGRLGRARGREPLVAAEAARDDRRPADQQHRRRHELRHVRVRPAAARLRPRPPGRAPAGRPPRPAGRDAHGDQRPGLRADAGDAGDRRRDAAGRPGGRDGRAETEIGRGRPTC